MKTLTIAEWAARPIRSCLAERYWCALCQGLIRYGERFHVAGYRSRAHVRCVNQARRVPVQRG